MLRGSKMTFYLEIRMILLAKIGQKFLPVKFSIKLIDLRNLNLQVFHIAFRQAAHYIQLLQSSLFLSLTKLQNHVNGFLLRVANETTRIDNSYFALRILTIVSHFISASLQLLHQFL